MIPPLADNEVISRVLSGDTEAFRVLVERHQRLVLTLARNFAPRWLPAEDVAQDVFVSAFAALRRFDASRGHFAGWLVTITKHHCLNARRKSRPILVEALTDAVASTTPADDLAGAEAGRCLDATFESLPDDQRTAFVLQECVGLTTERIADLEGVAPGTIRSRLSRAKATLRAALSRHLGGNP